MSDYQREINIETLWETVRAEAKGVVNSSPLLNEFYQQHILQHTSFEASLSYILAEKLTDRASHIDEWQKYLLSIMNADSMIANCAFNDLLCQLENNASIKDHYTPMLYFGGFQALQAYRFAHFCWNNNNQALASYIQSKVVSLFGVDIHPAANIGKRIFIDHAIGIVIGETAVIEDDVTLFQSVTLGGTGKGWGDRHPKIRQGAFIGSGAVVLGNIEIGKNAKIAAGAVVLKAVQPNQTVVGVAAKPV